MEEAKIAEKKPSLVELEPGNYFWCRCGHSLNQPFCDDSHLKTSFSPIEFTISEKRKVLLCRCKHSSNMPYCDGTHKKL